MIIHRCGHLAKQTGQVGYVNPALLYVSTRHQQPERLPLIIIDRAGHNLVNGDHLSSHLSSPLRSIVGGRGWGKPNWTYDFLSDKS